MDPDEVLKILEAGEYEDILVKQITNGSSSGRLFVPKKYFGMDAIIIIRDVEECPHCKGDGKRKKSHG